MIICCVCAALYAKGYEFDRKLCVTIYKSSAYCTKHLPDVDGIHAELKKRNREKELARKTVV